MNRFEYAHAASIEEVFSHAGESWDVRILAGGTDLLQEMKNNIIQPTRIIDIKSILSLKSIAEKGGVMEIGALVTLDEIEHSETIKNRLPILCDAAGEAASPQLRNMATIAGNICQRPRCWYYRHSDFPCLRKGGKRCFAVTGENAYHAIFGGGPCHIVCPSDLAPVLVALRASIIVRPSSDTEREIALEEFFVGPKVDPHRENILKPGDLVTQIRVPLPQENQRGIFLKSRERKTWDFASASVAALAVVKDGSITDASVVLGGVAPNPWRSKVAEATLRGAEANDQLAVQAARAAVGQAKPMRDNTYKVDLVENLVAEAVRTITAGAYDQYGSH